MASHHKPADQKPPHAAAQAATETDTFQVPKAMDDGRLRRHYEAHNTLWLQRTYYEETVKVFIHAWDLYVKFYTVFMTFNVTGLILAEHYISSPKQRSPVVAAFVVQNLLTMGTSFGIAMYTRETQKKLSMVAEHLAKSHIQIAAVAKGHPLPRRLGQWGGYANCIACLCLIFCWLAVGDVLPEFLRRIF